jgi:hypothetical protein
MKTKYFQFFKIIENLVAVYINTEIKNPLFMGLCGFEVQKVPEINTEIGIC